MGIYNEYYKKYYSNIGEQRLSRVYSSTNYGVNGKVENYEKTRNISPIFLNVFDPRYVNIFIAQCFITLVLLGGLILYRAYPESELGQVYKHGIRYMSNNVEVEELSKESVVAVFNEFKTFLDFNNKKEEYIRANYLNPIVSSGEINLNVEDEKLILNGGAETTIIASYDGKIKSVKDGVVVVNYGDGIEMVYHGLDEVNAIEGMAVASNDIIGKVISDSAKVSIIEILYMGGRLNPLNCFNLGKPI